MDFRTFCRPCVGAICAGLIYTWSRIRRYIICGLWTGYRLYTDCAYSHVSLAPTCLASCHSREISTRDNYKSAIKLWIFMERAAPISFIKNVNIITNNDASMINVKYAISRIYTMFLNIETHTVNIAQNLFHCVLPMRNETNVWQYLACLGFVTPFASNFYSTSIHQWIQP